MVVMDNNLDLVFCGKTNIEGYILGVFGWFCSHVSPICLKPSVLIVVDFIVQYILTVGLFLSQRLQKEEIIQNVMSWLHHQTEALQAKETMKKLDFNYNLLYSTIKIYLFIYFQKNYSRWKHPELKNSVSLWQHQFTTNMSMIIIHSGNKSMNTILPYK